MTNKELKRLTRAELLELLLAQTRESERLKARLYDAQMQLSERQLRVSQAGDMAQAALKVNGVLEAAQAAASQYLENVAALEQKTMADCRRMDMETREDCQQMLERTRAECERMLTEAREEASHIRSKSKNGQRKGKKSPGKKTK